MRKGVTGTLSISVGAGGNSLLAGIVAGLDGFPLLVADNMGLVSSTPSKVCKSFVCCSLNVLASFWLSPSLSDGKFIDGVNRFFGLGVVIP